MSAEEYIPASQKAYATLEDIYRMLEAALKVHNKTKLQRIIDDTMNKKVHYSFKHALEKALTSTYTELYQLVAQAAAKAI